MMEITRNNYEAYFLDYYEGTLSPAQTEALYLFLEQNPDLQAEFNAFENIRLTPDDTVHFPGKYLLKKNSIRSTGSITAANYEHYFVAAAESELNANDSDLLQRFLEKNPHLTKELTYTRATRLVPDLGIAYPYKHTLRKKAIQAPVRRLLYISTALAAVVIIILVILRPSFRHPISQRMQSLTDVPKTSGFPQQPVDTRAVVATPDLTVSVPQPQVKQVKASVITEYNAVKKHPEHAQHETAPGPRMAALNKMTHHYGIAETGMISLYKKGDPVLTGATRKTRLQMPPDNTIHENEMASALKNDNTDDYPSLFAFVISRIHNKIKEMPENKEKEQGISFWSLADLGVRGINQLTHGDIRIEHSYNENGKILSYSIGNDDFEISRVRDRNITRTH
jgi:hypothetical protein